MRPSVLFFALPLALAGCQAASGLGMPGLTMASIQHTKVVNASSVPICKVEIVHLGSKAGEGKNALFPTDVPIAPGVEKPAEVPRLGEGVAGGSWEVRSYTCRGLTHDADALLGKSTVEDPSQKVVLK